MMRRHLAVCSTNLSHPVVPSMMNDRLHGLAVLCLGSLGGRLLIVEVIAHPVASKNLRGHHLRMHASLLITQEKGVHAISLRPELGVWNRYGRARRSSGAAEGKGIIAFGSDHARVWQWSRTFFDDGAFEGTTGQQSDKEKSEKIGTHRFERTTAKNVCSIFRSWPPAIYSNLCKSRKDGRKSGQSEKSISAPAPSHTKQKKLQPKGNLMLWTIFVVLLILWLLGFIGHFGGQLIHLLLVIAVVVLIVNLISGRRTL